MDWDKINTLLDVIMKSVNVNDTQHIRAAAAYELSHINAGFAPKSPVVPTPPEPEPELPLPTRRV